MQVAGCNRLKGMVIVYKLFAVIILLLPATINRHGLVNTRYEKLQRLGSV